MNIALGERDLDPSFAEFPADRKVQLALEHIGTVRVLLRPDPQDEIQRAVSEFLKQDVGPGSLSTPGCSSATSRSTFRTTSGSSR